MTLRYMLDTDTASYLIKGRPQSVRAALLGVSPAEVCISAVTKAELLFGLRRLPPEHRLQLGVRRFLELMPALPWNAAEAYAEIRHRLASQPIGEMDMMIAAHAMTMSVALVTHNARHFGRIGAPLMLVDWHDGGA